MFEDDEIIVIKYRNFFRLELRPLGIFFIVVLGVFLYRTQCNFCLDIPPEFKRKCDRFVQSLRTLRQERPTMFCAMSSCCLGALAILGHLLTGTALVVGALTVAAVVSARNNLKFIRIERTVTAWPTQLTTDNDNDEFLPEDNETNMFVLERACDLTTLSLNVDDPDDDDERSDDLPSELMLPDNSLAELDEHSSNNDEDIEELLPIMPVKEQTTDVIEFKRGHFKRDSSLSTTSSSSEESLSKGLQFQDVNADGSENKLVHFVESSTATLFEKGAKLLPELVSGLVQWSQAPGVLNSTDLKPSTSIANTVHSTALSKVMPTVVDKGPQRRLVTALDSSDESDFEMLQEEDFMQ